MSSFFTQLFCATFLNLKFVLIISFNERIPAQKMLLKCLWNWHQVSISSTFYVSIFCTKVLCKYFSITVQLCDFFGARILAQKLLLKCWWNWLRVMVDANLQKKFFSKASRFQRSVTAYICDIFCFKSFSHFKIHFTTTIFLTKCHIVVWCE